MSDGTTPCHAAQVATDAPTTSADTASVESVLEWLGHDPGRAVTTADTVIAAARDAGDAASESAAWRARGLAHRELNDLDSALADLQQAIQVAEASGVRQAAAEARMSIVGVHAENGDLVAAIAESERASADLTGVPAARARAQHGALLSRAGHFPEAMAVFREALPALRAGGDQLWEAKALNNRGMVRMYQGELREGADDVARAEELFLSAGHTLYAAEACWNRGFIAARQGDVPQALTHFDTSETRFAAHGLNPPEMLLDRCDVLLSVGLYAEALSNAGRALAATAENRAALWADAHLSFAQAALGAGHRDRAAGAARKAAELFTAQHRPSWAALARYVQLRCAEDTIDGLDAVRTADELARAGWRTPELEARIISARIALRDGDLATGRDQLRQASTAKRSGTMGVRARAWHADALLRLADGDRAGAKHALLAGLRALDEHRATLGATELRVHTAVHGQDLAELGLDLALADGDPAEVLRWVERWRAGATRWRPARPPDDAILADLLAELRRIAAKEQSERLDGRDPAKLARQRQALEQQVLERTRRSVGEAGPAVPTRIDPTAFGARTLVEYLVAADRVRAVTVRDGTVDLHDLGSATDMQRNLDQLRFALRTLAMAPVAAARDTARMLFDVQARALDDQLLGPLAAAIGSTELVLVPSTTLRDVPWAALPTCLGRPVSVVPSALLWQQAARRPVTAAGRVSLVAGPDLDHAEAEIAQLGYAGATVLAGPDATAAAVLRELDGAQVAHLATHGTVRADNPFFSALHVADGPLTVFDLERLRVAPELVVLPACQSGVTVARAGDEVLGLTAALLALGSRCLIATTAPVPDAGTRELMTQLHERLRAGEDPAHALAHAQRPLLAAADHDTFAAAAAFACYGAGS
jgi:CHAT domain-containing protein/tetratricopeptide (TPR) repeat protein